VRHEPLLGRRHARGRMPSKFADQGDRLRAVAASDAIPSEVGDERPATATPATVTRLA